MKKGRQIIDFNKTCERCGGAGLVRGKVCVACNGSGRPLCDPRSSGVDEAHQFNTEDFDDDETFKDEPIQELRLRSEPRPRADHSVEVACPYCGGGPAKRVRGGDRYRCPSCGSKWE